MLTFKVKDDEHEEVSSLTNKLKIMPFFHSVVHEGKGKVFSSFANFLYPLCVLLESLSLQIGNIE